MSAADAEPPVVPGNFCLASMAVASLESFRPVAVDFVATSPPIESVPSEASGLRELTNREVQAMKLAAEGLANDVVAAELHLSS
ncbi:hypothetical protein GCM10029976_043100 [Kribbella albertanoniae]|uniref:HTH luxR-type domain-containing protein n=1 Tax=Kribbella albertanoniae TaxID=1266829 RepID=A0A4R4Q713_9ACTN|nr:LuxR C-terminal-related transcriptional regulator [Kribbella albertanoniae]TDC30967.1 hypothetical protein E1261_11945 [Kribbella albertanoniae]